MTAYYMAHIHGLRNDWRNAMRFLRQSLEKGEDSVVDYSVDPALRTIQADPQFQEQIAKTVLSVIVAVPRIGSNTQHWQKNKRRGR